MMLSCCDQKPSNTTDCQITAGLELYGTCKNSWPKKVSIACFDVNALEIRFGQVFFQPVSFVMSLQFELSRGVVSIVIINDRDGR
jgi:hypothetical protein